MVAVYSIERLSCSSQENGGSWRILSIGVTCPKLMFWLLCDINCRLPSQSALFSMFNIAQGARDSFASVHTHTYTCTQAYTRICTYMHAQACTHAHREMEGMH